MRQCMQLLIDRTEDGMIQLQQDVSSGDAPYVNMIFLYDDQVQQVIDWLQETQKQKIP